MEKLGTSILITSLNDQAGSALAQKLSQLLGLHFASCKDIVEYDLFDSDAILTKCGVQYFEQREKSALSDISSYENSVIYIDYDLIKNNLAIFDQIHPRIFLNFPKRKLSKDAVLNIIAFEERNAYLREICDLTVDVNGDNKSSLSKLVKDIREKL